MGAERPVGKLRTIRAKVLIQGVAVGLCKMGKVGDAVVAVAAAGLVGVVADGVEEDVKAGGALGMEAEGMVVRENLGTFLASSVAAPKLAQEVAVTFALSTLDLTVTIFRTMSVMILTNGTTGSRTKLPWLACR